MVVGCKGKCSKFLTKGGGVNLCTEWVSRGVLNAVYLSDIKGFDVLAVVLYCGLRVGNKGVGRKTGRSLIEKGQPR